MLLYPRDKSAIYTVVSYAPATCTENEGRSECGPATITVETADGELRHLHHDGNERPEGHAAGHPFDVYRPGAKLELTTVGDEVIRVERVDKSLWRFEQRSVVPPL